MISELLKNSLPQYEAMLPESKLKCKFRPMTVKEEKILLLAQQSDNIKEIANAVSIIIKNCFDIKNPEKLSIADVEKAFLELRSKSIGEKLSFFLKTENDNIPLEIDVRTFDYEENPNKTNKIKLNDDMVLVLKEPEFQYLMETAGNESDSLKNVFKYCFSELQTSSNVYKKADVSAEDLSIFYDYMTREQLDKFYEFVEKIPRMVKTIEYTKKDGTKDKLTLRGIESFFVFASAT